MRNKNSILKTPYSFFYRMVSSVYSSPGRGLILCPCFWGVFWRERGWGKVVIAKYCYIWITLTSERKVITTSIFFLSTLGASVTPIVEHHWSQEYFASDRAPYLLQVHVQHFSSWIFNIKFYHAFWHSVKNDCFY